MPPDPESIEAVATELGVDPSFVEKDWYAIRLVATVAGVREGDLKLVFSDGTSLSKGYGLIRRFSEDLDFRVLLPEAGVQRPARQRYRSAVIEAIRAGDDWMLPDDGVEAGNESRFFRCHVGYPTTSAVAPTLRPELRLEVTFSRPALVPEDRSLRSFVAEARREHPEVPRIGCVVPAETAADKISALAWRVLDPIAGQDPALIRHVHDVAVLEPHAVKHADFPELLQESLMADAVRGTPDPHPAGWTPPSASLLRSTSFPIETMQPSTRSSSAPCATATRTTLRHTGMPSRPSGVSECACLDCGLEQVAARVAQGSETAQRPAMRGHSSTVTSVGGNWCREPLSPCWPYYRPRPGRGHRRRRHRCDGLGATWRDDSALGGGFAIRAVGFVAISARRFPHAGTDRRA